VSLIIRKLLLDPGNSTLLKSDCRTSVAASALADLCQLKLLSHKPIVQSSKLRIGGLNRVVARDPRYNEKQKEKAPPDRPRDSQLAVFHVPLMRC
jgi:hypothetical protein